MVAKHVQGQLWTLNLVKRKNAQLMACLHLGHHTPIVQKHVAMEVKPVRVPAQILHPLMVDKSAVVQQLSANHATYVNVLYMVDSQHGLPMERVPNCVEWENKNVHVHVPTRYLLMVEEIVWGIFLKLEFAKLGTAK